MGASGLDRTDDFQKFCGSGLDRIQFYRFRTGLGLKYFTVHISVRDEHGSGMDRIGSGLKPILAGSGLDRTEKIFAVLM